MTVPQPSLPPARDESGTWLRRRWDVAVVAACWVYFAAAALYFALAIHPDIPPDEATHVGRSQLFAQSWRLPAASAESYTLGLLPGEPYLYYCLMGRVLNLNVFGWPDLLVLRLANVVLGMATVVCGQWWFNRTTGHPAARSLFAVMLTNTLMFVFLAGSVSYDNLVNLLAVTALVFATRFFDRPNALDGGAFTASVLAGTLTKTTYLPLALLFAVLVAVHGRHVVVTVRGSSRHQRRLKGTGTFFGCAFFSDPYANRPKNEPVPDARERLRLVQGASTLLRSRCGNLCPGEVLLGVLCAVLLALNVGLYGTNLVRYGRPVPKPGQVLSHELLMQYRIYARNWIAQQHREGTMSYEAALAASEQIAHESDQADLQTILAIQENRRHQPIRELGRLDHALNWLVLVTQRSFGILGHRVVNRGLGEVLVYWLVFLLGLGLLLRMLISRRQRAADIATGGRHLYDAAFLAVGYGLVILQVNHGHYAASGIISDAVHGRYLFPVLVPACGVVARYLVVGWPERWQPIAGRLAAAAAGAWFLWGGLPYFLRHATEEWFR